MADRTLTVKIIGDSRQLQREFQRAGKAGKGFDTQMAKVSRRLKFAVVGGGIAGIAGITRGLVSSVKAAQEAETAQVRLRQALSTTGASYKAQGKQIDAAIQRTSKLAALDDEELSDAFAKLVRTTGDVKTAMRDMSIAADIARGRNISLEQATKIVEKAEVGQLRGLKAIGVQIDKGTTSTQALDRAQRKFAGSAARYGKTAAGAQDKLAVAFENLEERVGAHLLPVLTKLALKLVDLIDFAEKNWPRFQKAVEPVVKAVREFGPVVAAMFKIVKPIMVFWFGKVFPTALKATAEALKIVAQAAQVMGRIIAAVVGGVITVIDKFLAGFQALAEAASHLPFVGDRFKGVAESIQGARDNLAGLTKQLDNLSGKTAKVRVVTSTLDKLEGNRAGLPVRAPASVGVVAGRQGLVMNFHGDIVTPDPEAFIRMMEKRARRTSVGRR